jgi:hypothetical protein
VPSFFLDGVGDDSSSLLEESSIYIAFEHSPSPYPNPANRGLPTSSIG